MKKRIAALTLGTMLFLGSSGVAVAGEVTGSGRGGPDGDGITPIKSHTAASECAFSGLEDEPLAPGTVQTPAEVAGTGIPGQGTFVTIPGVGTFFTSCNPQDTQPGPGL